MARTIDEQLQTKILQIRTAEQADSVNPELVGASLELLRRQTKEVGNTSAKIVTVTGKNRFNKAADKSVVSASETSSTGYVITDSKGHVSVFTSASSSSPSTSDNYPDENIFGAYFHQYFGWIYDSSMFTSHKISLDADAVTATFFNGGIAKVILAFDASGNYLGYVATDSSDWSHVTMLASSFPTADYIRLSSCVISSDLNATQLENGSSPTAYEAYTSTRAISKTDLPNDVVYSSGQGWTGVINSIETLAAKQGLLEADLNALGPKIGEPQAIPVTGSLQRIDLSVGIGNTVSLTPAASTYSYSISDITEGDTLIINGTGGSGPRLWGIIDSQNKLLAVADASTTASNLKIVAPQDSAKLIINDNSGSISYIISAAEKKVVLVSDIVNDINIGGANVPASAEVVKNLGLKTSQFGNELGMSEFEIGTININASTAWTYPTTTYQKRIRTPQGKEFYLTKGSIISLSDYTDAQFLLSCRDANGGYHGKTTWQTADFVCEYSGYYVLVIANKTEVDLTEQTAAALAALVKITKYADIAYDNDFNEDGFVVKMAYDKGSDFVDGTSRTLTLKCALYYSKVGTKHLKGVYSINQTFTFPKNKFTYLLADVTTGAFTLTNDDTDLYVGGKVVLLSMTPSGYLQGHLAPWAYQRLLSAKHDADIATINDTINSMSGGVDFEIGNIYTYSSKIWVYNTYGKRIRCKKPFRLTRGSIISLSDYTDAQFFLCCRDDDGVYHNQGTWLSTDFRCQYTGDYVLVVGNKTEVDLTDETAAALAAMVKIIPFIDIANEKQGNCYFQFHGHPFYSHLLMDKQNANAIIPCQSIYDVNMAARLGFKFIEPSGAITSDGVYLCNHTVAATIDGATKQVFAGGVKYRGTTTPANDFAVNTKTAAWIRENCCYFSKYAKYESFVPTLEEFCIACRQNNIGVFLSANRMQDIETALSIIGPDNLIIYSSNIDFLLACRVRYDNITMMYYHNAAYTDADSCLATAYKIGKPLLYCIDVPIFNNMSDADMHEFVTKMHKNGYIVGMAANYTNEANARKAIKFGFDAFASGHHINPFEGNLHHLCGDVTWEGFTISENNSSVVDGNLVLQNNGYIQGGDENTIHYLSKMNLLVKFYGTLNIYLSGSGSGGVQQVTSDGAEYEFFSDYGIEKAISFTITSVGETTIYGLQFDASKC